MEFIQNRLSPIERWLRKNNYRIKEFAEVIGCKPAVISKLKSGLPIPEKVATQIYFITSGYVDAEIIHREK